MLRKLFSRPQARRLVPTGLARAPVHPGHFLGTRFLRPAGISQDALARALGISRRRVNELILGRRGITADTAVRLAEFFGTDARFWLQLQAAWDAHQAWRSLRSARSLAAPSR